MLSSRWNEFYVLLHVMMIVSLGIITRDARAQEGFSHIVDNPSSDSWIRLVSMDLEGDTLTLMGAYGDVSFGVAGLILMQYDTLGNYLNHNVLVDSAGSFNYIDSHQSADVLRTSRGTLLVPFSNFNRGTRSNVCEVGRDLEIKNVWKFEVDSVFTVFSIELVELVDRFIVFGLMQALDYRTFVLAVAFDKDGNELWQHVYGDPNSIGFNFGSVYKVDDNEIVVGAVDVYSNPQDEDDKLNKTWIFAIDSLGMEKWSWKSQPRDDGVWIAYNLHQHPAGGWIFNTLDHYYLEVAPNYFEIRPIPKVVSLDAQFENETILDLNNGLVDYNQRYTDAILVDDYYYLVGQAGVEYTFDLISLGGRITKVPANFTASTVPTWDVIDTPAIGPSLAYLQGVTVAPSGSVFACGRVSNGSSQNHELGWLLKVTADGCIDTLCEMTSPVSFIPEIPQFRVYPNPAVDHITIDPGRPTDEFKFELFDLHGRLHLRKDVQSVTKIRLDDQLASGMYVWKISDARITSQSRTGKIVIK